MSQTTFAHTFTNVSSLPSKQGTEVSTVENMKKRVEFGQCAYCGRTGRLTRDHVPPKNLFAPPRPSNLISVPSCKHYNREASKDDEYFRLALTMRMDTYDHPDVSKLLPTVYRSLRKPTKLGFSWSFLSTLREVIRRAAKARRWAAMQFSLIPCLRIQG